LNIRYYIDPESELPHIHRHDVDETEVEEVRAQEKIDLAERGQELPLGEQRTDGISESFMFLIRPRIVFSQLQLMSYKANHWSHIVGEGGEGKNETK